MMKKILILGSTGSIGVNALTVVREFPDEFEVTGITANENIDLLRTQITEFKPNSVVVKDNVKAAELKNIVNGSVEVLTGEEGLIEITKRGDYDILVSSLVGFAGLAPTIEAIKLKKRIALANKETLVAAGEIITGLCSQYQTELIPVDSEHSAIFQCLVGETKNEISKLILTASGGPFFNKTAIELKDVTIAEALNHPNWKMGNKITIDSATMMNKGLEVIEAHWLFNLPKEKIEVLIHPQSIVHSMVEFIDSSIKAQLSMPDMKVPIQYALTYPKRLYSKFVETDFTKIQKLTFFEPDFVKFPCLKLAFDAIGTGGTAPCTLNAANEIAVSLFLKGKVSFLRISQIIEDVLNKIEIKSHPDIETIFENDRQTRSYLNKVYN
jgi:1-deoxy-D-xylulose-5-phosphate reductoisomerase